MKSKSLTKGISLIAIMVLILMNFGFSFLFGFQKNQPSSDLMVQNVYAQEEGESEGEQATDTGEGEGEPSGQPPEWLQQEAESEGFAGGDEGEAEEPAADEGGEGEGEGEEATGADEGDPEEAINAEEVIQKIAEMATYIHRFFAPLINFFAFQIGNFLGTDYIFEGPMGQMLHRIWVVSRNLVNIAFVFLLLWMALKEIFAIGSEAGGELKKNLIKFALLMVAVNFSWLGTKVVLDAANVVTNVVFAIPSGISSVGVSFQGCQINDPEDDTEGLCIPTAIYFPMDSTDKKPFNYRSDNCEEPEQGYEDAYITQAHVDAGDALPEAVGGQNPVASEENEKFKGRGSICWESMNLFKYDQNTSVVYLMYGMARIQNLIKSSADGITSLAVGTLMSLVIQIAYTVSLLALFIALIIRMAVLWLFVAFSPFLILVIWFRGTADVGGEYGFGLHAFAKWAFVPALVGVVFSVSFLMLAAGQTFGGTETTIIDKLGDKGFTAKIIKIKSLFMGMDTLQEFIWLVITLVVLWMGVFAILRDMPIIRTVSEKINDMGKRTAELIAKSPYWAPILPMVGKEGERTSLRSIVSGISPLAKLEKEYAEATGERSVSELDEKSKKVNKHEITRLLERASKYRASQNTTEEKKIARQIAHMYGASNVSDLMKHGKATLLKAFRRANGDTKAQEMYELVSRFKMDTGEILEKAKKPAAGTAEAAAKPAAAPAAGPAAQGGVSGDTSARVQAAGGTAPTPNPPSTPPPAE